MRRSNADLVTEVAVLGDLPREGLAALWEKAHGHLPPKGIRHELLLRSATWHLQAKRLGGLTPATRRVLKTAMADAGQTLFAKASIVSPGHPSGVDQRQLVDDDAGTTSNSERETQTASRRRSSVSPGDRLVRDWNGKTYIVDVIEEGFVFQAKVYKSLTVIAQQITGAHWSGPRFFGL